VPLRVLQILRLVPAGRLSPAFGRLEGQLLEALWRREEPASVRQISADFPEAAYTTLMTTLDRLFRKGVLDRERVGRAFRYRPRFSRQELEARLTADALHAFLDREPGGLKPALSFFVEAVGRRDERLLEELEALIRKRRHDEGGKP
jgi:predicted transcriptional regulator